MSKGRRKGQQTFPIILVFYILLIFAVASVYYIISDIPSARSQNGIVSLGSGAIALQGNTTINATGVMYTKTPSCGGDMLQCAGTTIGNVINLGFLDSDITFLSVLIFVPLSILFILAAANYIKSFIPTVGGS